MKYFILLILLITSSFSHILKRKAKKRKILRERRLEGGEVKDLPLMVHNKELELAEVREKVRINKENAETLGKLGEFAKELLKTLDSNYNRGIIEIDAAIVNARSLLEED